MKKRLLQGLAVLGVFGVNLVVGLLAGVAVPLYFLMDDPILAAVPALLALPGLLLQPWSVLFLIIPGGLLFAPLLTTVVTVLLWVLLDHQGKLDRARRILARLRRPRAILVMGLVVVCALAVGLARLVDFPPLRRGIPPHTFQHVVKDMQFDPDTARYYCLVRFGDSQWLLQVRLSEQDLEVLANKSRMHPIPADRIGKIYLDMRPYWWQPVISDRVRSLATTDFPMENRGPDGLHLLATWNPEDEILHMWIKDNFLGFWYTCAQIRETRTTNGHECFHSLSVGVCGVPGLGTHSSERHRGRSL